MMWNLTFLLVHLCALGGAFFLYRSAPCWMQKLTMVGMGIAMLTSGIAFGLAFFGLEHLRWPVFIIALLIEHIAVLLYIFRLIYKDHWQWNFSPHFHSSHH